MYRRNVSALTMDAKGPDLTSGSEYWKIDDTDHVYEPQIGTDLVTGVKGSLPNFVSSKLDYLGTGRLET